MTHKFTLKGDYQTKEIWMNGKPLSPTKSQMHINHSPDGFNWGYGGSGPAQLALAICIELGVASSYQAFKWEIVSRLPQSDFEETEFEFTTYKESNEMLANAFKRIKELEEVLRELLDDYSFDSIKKAKEIL